MMYVLINERNIHLALIIMYFLLEENRALLCSLRTSVNDRMIQ